jgi:hypothetical protein
MLQAVQVVLKGATFWPVAAVPQVAKSCDSSAKALNSIALPAGS